MQFAFVFPGQGSQSLGMLSDLSTRYPIVKQTFDEASDILGYDLWKLTQEGPESELNSTERTQPAMLVAGVAVWRVWRGNGGPRPVYMLGHSLGEYTALVCADSMAFGDAVSVVAARGRFMQDAVPLGEGAVAAILGLDDQRVGDVCEAAAQNEVVSAVNFNAPGQVVVAGHRSAVDRAVEGAKAAGAKRALILPVSVPVHCALMEQAAESLRAKLTDTEISVPSVRILHNVDVASHDDPEMLREVLIKQLYSPVRWADSIRRIADDSVDVVAECGPGRVLTGLTRRIDKRLSALSIFDEDSLDDALERIGSEP